MCRLQCAITTTTDQHTRAGSAAAWTAHAQDATITEMFGCISGARRLFASFKVLISLGCAASIEAGHGRCQLAHHHNNKQQHHPARTQRCSMAARKEKKMMKAHQNR